MLPASELQARIAAEFLRVGASQQSWDQNFPTQPSTWVPSVAGPVLSEESLSTYGGIAAAYLPQGGSGALLPEGADPIGRPITHPMVQGIICPPGSQAQYAAAADLWYCTLPDGSLVTSGDPDEEFVWTPSPTGQSGQTGSATNPTPAPTSTAPVGGALPPFIGGRLGKVLYTPISNRNLNGVRVGILPRVVMGDVAPAGYGTQPGVVAGGGGNDMIQP